MLVLSGHKRPQAATIPRHIRIFNISSLYMARIFNTCEQLYGLYMALIYNNCDHVYFSYMVVIWFVYGTHIFNELLMNFSKKTKQVNK